MRTSPCGFLLAALAGALVPIASLPAAEPAFYVAPGGNDHNAGTRAAPFATLEAARQAMENSRVVKTTYLRAGLYRRTKTFILTAADSGETWTADPADPRNAAILDAANAPGVNGILINGGSHITIDGLQIENVDAYGIGIHGGIDDADTYGGIPEFTAAPTAASNTIANTIIHDISNVANAYGTPGGIIVFENAPGTTIRNNVVHNAAVMGIQAYSQTAGGLDNLLIENNVVYDQGYQTTSHNDGDTGAIYLQVNDYRHSKTGTPAPSANIRVTHNYIWNWCGGRGIYIDQNTTNVAITANIIGPPNATCLDKAINVPAAIFYDSGADSPASGNLIDLGRSARLYIAAFADYAHDIPTSGNAITNNIVIMNFPGANRTQAGDNGAGGAYAGTPAGPETISHNAYYNYGGGATPTTANGMPGGDTAPLLANPQISGWPYAIASDSPVFRAPVNFAPITGGWGPPGYVLPPPPATAQPSPPATPGS